MRIGTFQLMEGSEKFTQRTRDMANILIAGKNCAILNGEDEQGCR
jgi:hypothetical protein